MEGKSRSSANSVRAPSRNQTNCCSTPNISVDFNGGEEDVEEDDKTNLEEF